MRAWEKSVTKKTGMREIMLPELFRVRHGVDGCLKNGRDQKQFFFWFSYQILSTPNALPRIEALRPETCSAGSMQTEDPPL
jgi:hypothetical protein